MKKISPLIIILLALFVPVLSWADSNFTTLSATGTSQVVSVRKPGFWSREKTALNNRLAFWKGKFTAWGNTQA
ncbi:MAG: hypothetical protein NTV48_03615, partial [Candidatus Vogelbacteria bacterium]|nr:hypothetical protein [Candidatus Vogelbacteria bacterium]